METRCPPHSAYVLEQLHLVLWTQTKVPFLQADKECLFYFLGVNMLSGLKGIPGSDESRLPVLLLVETGWGRLPATAGS